MRKFKKTNKWRKIKKYFKLYERPKYIGAQMITTYDGDGEAPAQEYRMQITDVKIKKAGRKIINYNFCAKPICEK